MLSTMSHPLPRRVDVDADGIPVHDPLDAESWPRVEDLVPPELPPELAVARLVALSRSLLAENRQLRARIARQADGGGTPLAFTPIGDETG